MAGLASMAGEWVLELAGGCLPLGGGPSGVAGLGAARHKKVHRLLWTAKGLDGPKARLHSEINIREFPSTNSETCRGSTKANHSYLIACWGGAAQAQSKIDEAW